MRAEVSTKLTDCDSFDLQLLGSALGYSDAPLLHCKVFTLLVDTGSTTRVVVKLALEESIHAAKQYPTADLRSILREKDPCWNAAPGSPAHRKNLHTVFIYPFVLRT